MTETKQFVYILDALTAEACKYVSNKIGLKNYDTRRVIPPFSFEPDASYILGQHPEESNSGTHYVFNPSNSIFSTKKYILQRLPEKPVLLKKVLKRIIINFTTSTKAKRNLLKMKMGNVPFKLLPYFSESNDLLGLYDENNVRFRNSIFSKLKKNGIDYNYIGPPFTFGTLDSLLKVGDKKIMSKDVNILFITDLDGIGHKFGSSSTQYYEKLDEIITVIKKNNETSIKRGCNPSLMIFGDHGMSDVKETVDIENVIKKLPLKEVRDYVYFLDSTLARFWFFNDRARDLIMEQLKSIKKGKWISNEEIIDYRINFKDNRFGDAIWWVNDGILISPNFWQGTKLIKGMHGYKKSDLSNHTAVCMEKKYFDEKKDNLDMVDIYNLLIKFLNIN